MTRNTPLAGYMKCKDSSSKTNSNREGFYELAKKYELNSSMTQELKDYSHGVGIEFLSSPFDVDSVRELCEMGVERLKIASGEMVNPFLLRAAAETELPLLVSTGMSTVEEIRWALDFLKENNSGPVTLLHCVSQYPTEFKIC